MAEDENSKTNGVVPDPMQRLPSFKAPRDLTLGGVKTNKKVFTPNLNVTRNKNKGPITKENDQKKEDKDRRNKRNDKNRNNKNCPNIIKSSGVFSEGLASVERHTTRSYYGKDSDPTQTMQRPTIRVKDFVKIDKELEEQKIKSVMGDVSNLNDYEETTNFNQVLDKDAPVQLPMDGGGWSQIKSKMNVKQEVVIKKEPGDIECDIDGKPVIPDVKEATEFEDVVKLLNTNQPTLIFLQLPDTLPGRGGKMKDEGSRRKVVNDEPSTSTSEDKPSKPVDTRCLLSDLEEGRIGKLRIHRSGRVSLALGNTMFEVWMGTNASCYQEVISISVDEQSRSANLVALGALQHKLIVVPDWELLFKDMTIK